MGTSSSHEATSVSISVILQTYTILSTLKSLEDLDSSPAVPENRQKNVPHVVGACHSVLFQPF